MNRLLCLLLVLAIPPSLAFGQAAEPPHDEAPMRPAEQAPQDLADLDTTVSSDTRGTAVVPEPGVASASPAEAPQYIIGPGDVLQVFVWRNPELSTTVPVRPDGKISTPLVEDMPAVGKNPSELARDMEGILSEYVRTPKVNIIVTEPASRFSQVKVVGQVLRPQSVAYREGMTVLDVILESGGLTPFAAGNRARIVRQVDGKDIEIRLKLDDLLNKGRLETNYDVKPGDVLVVPESYF